MFSPQECSLWAISHQVLKTFPSCCAKTPPPSAAQFSCLCTYLIGRLVFIWGSFCLWQTILRVDSKNQRISFFFCTSVSRVALFDVFSVLPATLKAAPCFQDLSQDPGKTTCVNSLVVKGSVFIVTVWQRVFCPHSYVEPVALGQHTYIGWRHPEQTERVSQCAVCCLTHRDCDKCSYGFVVFSLSRRLKKNTEQCALFD